MGIFSLVLHTHLPYVRKNGVWPCGEDFFHQAALESYLPLIGALQRLGEAGLRDAITVGLSPMIAHQMHDPYMRAEFDSYLGRWQLRTIQQASSYDGTDARAIRNNAAFHWRFARAQERTLDALSGGIAAGFDALARAGVIEILGGPATHPYLPLVREPVLARAQVRLGVREHERVFGRAPRGAWLPECAYDPAAEIEDLLAANGIDHVVVDGPTMLRSAGPGSTFRPRRIGASSVIACARNLDVTYRVWSPTGGYPTGKWYRDFFRYDMQAGFKNWRVTSIRKTVKQLYEPERALTAARRDAEDFAALITRTLDEYETQSGVEGHIVAAYDTELFGHWWFEGPAFLEHLFTVLQESATVRPMSLASALEQLPEPERVDLVAGSWGLRKDDRSWVTGETHDIWDALGSVEAETVRLLEKFADASLGVAREAALEQLVREAFLLQASDWPFMIVRGRNPAYARERFDGHRARWEHLAELIRSRLHDDTIARHIAPIREQDNILPGLRLKDL